MKNTNTNIDPQEIAAMIEKVDIWIIDSRDTVLASWADGESKELAREHVQQLNVVVANLRNVARECNS